MTKKTFNGTAYFEFDIFRKHRGLKHAVFTRRFNIKNKLEIKTLFGTRSEPVYFKKQLHGTDILIVRPVQPRAPMSLRTLRPHSVPKQSHISHKSGDILLTSEAGIPLLIRIADCASILIFDPNARAIANIHAGWRGLAENVINKAITAMKKRFGSAGQNLIAAISPMLGPCCARFTNPRKELPKHMHKFITKENTVDLWAVAESQLKKCGVHAENIENPRICTSCDKENFYSYRRGDIKKRFGAAIMLK